MEKRLNIIQLFPDLLNLYGDKGNISALKWRLEERGIGANIIEYKLDDEISLTDADIVFLGGGSDREQLLVCQKLISVKVQLKSFVENNGVLLAVCGGYQLLGHYYKMNNEKIEGLSLVDLYTEQKEGRLIGNVVIETAFGTVAGFENHGGRTYLGKDVSPLGRVVYGCGNNNEDKHEGMVYKNVFGTYLHGPLLPKNSELTDELILRAMQRKYGEFGLIPLDDIKEKRAKQWVIDKYAKNVN